MNALRLLLVARQLMRLVLVTAVPLQWPLVRFVRWQQQMLSSLTSHRTRAGPEAAWFYLDLVRGSDRRDRPVTGDFECAVTKLHRLAMAK
jgi:hypothetical protein